MIHPSYVDLMEVVNKNVEEGETPVINSRYSIVMATAKRARQIVDGDEPLVKVSRGEKPLSIAVDELNQEEIRILAEDEVEEEYVISAETGSEKDVPEDELSEAPGAEEAPEEEMTADENAEMIPEEESAGAEDDLLTETPAYGEAEENLPEETLAETQEEEAAEEEAEPAEEEAAEDAAAEDAAEETAE